MLETDQISDEAFLKFLPGGKVEDDSSLIVEFYVDKKLMGAQSENWKRPVYEDREYVRIRIKGQKHQVVVHEVNDALKQRFPIAYQRFLLKKPSMVVGTPIEHMAGVGPSLAEHLKLLGLRTIEDVANVSDENALRSMGIGARELQRRAKAFLSQESERSVNLEEENKILRESLADMNKRIAAVETPKDARIYGNRVTRRKRKARRKSELPAAP